MRPSVAAIIVGLLATSLGACGPGASSPASAGPGALPPSATAPLVASPSASRPASPVGPSSSPAETASTPETPMPVFTLTSTAFDPGGSIPRRFTCDGEDVSPDLAWSAAPADTTALVLIVDDPDARGFVHWLVLDLAGSQAGALPPGISSSPNAPAQGTNDFGRFGWGGPCPPSGEHRYVFTLYALAAPLGLNGAPRGEAVRRALDGATVLGTAILGARYRRGG